MQGWVAPPEPCNRARGFGLGRRGSVTDHLIRFTLDPDARDLPLM